MKYIHMFNFITYLLSPLTLYLLPDTGWFYFMFCGAMGVAYYGIDLYYTNQISIIEGRIKRIRKDPHNYYTWR